MTIRYGNNIIAGTPQSVINSKVNLNFDNSTAITNCLTEIPQNIKLEINNNRVILKVGSIVYIPDGFEQDGVTRKFNIVTINTDLIQIDNTWPTNQGYLFYNHNDNSVYNIPVSLVVYGNTQPTVPSGNSVMLWYNSNTNIIMRTADGGTTWDSTIRSLPLGIISWTKNTYDDVDSIDLIFNGLGYIDCVGFAYPGIKGLIPNGRNSDGTLNNLSFTTNSVLFTPIYNNTYSDYYLRISANALNITSMKYNEVTNFNTDSTDTTTYSSAIVGIVSADTGKIISFSKKNTFRAISMDDIDTKFRVVSTLPANPDPNIFYFIPES